MTKINIGDKFGRLTVLRETTKEERVNPAGRNYECLCECGNKIIVYGHNLKTGNTKSCGCLSRDISRRNNTVDIPIGTRFGSLIITGRAPVHSNHLAYWYCKCDCGNTCEVPGTRLRNGEITSCGCDKYPNKINELGNQYGRLTVIEYAGSRENGGALWKCKCECGNTIIVRGDELRSGHTKSCGCIKSWKEYEIHQLLQKYHIPYTSQYCFADLKTDKGGYLRFDFCIYNSDNTIRYLVEYQGTQHTESDNNWYSDEYVNRDIFKAQYCKGHNLKLILWDKTTDIESEIRRWCSQ